MNTSATTFWNLLSDTGIEIPIIQRDYAQGRSGKEELRKSFLRDFKHALLDSKEPLKLDFVYGTMEGGNLIPLDGQQRLTTLWLLHWYVAYMSGEINDNTSKIFKRFSYETRISSREFCERLSYFSKPLPDGKGIVAHIQNQTWFRSSWHHDPTIQSMLRTLGGSEHGALDGIEGVFNACHDGECVECRLNQCPLSQVKCDSYDEYWNRLTDDECPIVFHYLDIHGIGQTDDLYIKMNARGKPLTSFENFKADLAGYISRQATEASNAGDSCKKLNHPETGLAIKMDTDWMNGIFWKNKSSDSVVDEIYFAFINRFFFNAYALTMTEAGDIKVGDDKVFDFLYGRNASKESADARIAYLGFDSVYRKVIEKDVGILDRLVTTLDNYKAVSVKGFSMVSNLFRPPWESGDFHFVPQYKKDEKGLDFAGNTIREIAGITQPHRVVFHAVCKFFAQGWDAVDEKKELLALKEWMRVVWNIVENANVDTISGMVGCLKLLDELGSHSHNILEGLKSSGRSLKSRFAADQVAEEVEKAEQIVSDKSGEWRGRIEKAEKTAYFKGAIRFLFLDGSGKTDWSEFDKKFANAETYFDANGVSELYKAAITRALVLGCEKWNGNGGLNDNQIFNTNATTWKRILCSESFANAVHCILVSDGLENVHASKSLDDDQNARMYVKPVLGDFPFHWAVKNVPEGRIRWTHYGKLVFYKPYSQDDSRKIIFDWENFHRNRIFNDLGREIEIDSSNQIKDCRHFVRGWDVSFKYMNHWFRWLGSPNRSSGEFDIYLLKEKWKDDSSYAKHDKDTSKEGDEQEFFCFNVNTEVVNDFKTKLQELITAYTDSGS